MDISQSVEPRSDQLNFDDVQVHDLTIMITAVKQGHRISPCTCITRSSRAARTSRGSRCDGF